MALFQAPGPDSFSRPSCRDRRGTSPSTRDDWLRFNASLDEDARLARLDEPLLERRTDELESMAVDPEPFYWLTMARLTELALYCAGGYADHAEFRAAGDLLVNPRVVWVHMRGMAEPAVKNRHGRMTDQFKEPGEDRARVVQRLKSRSVVEIGKKALVPHLEERLRASGRVTSTYLDSIDKRKKRIADTLAFLHAWPANGMEDFCSRLQRASSAERKFILDHLCRFDLSLYNELGRVILGLDRDEAPFCRVLRAA